jgi:hypothetical protein
MYGMNNIKLFLYRRYTKITQKKRTGNMHADFWSEFTTRINYIGRPKYIWYVTNMDLNKNRYVIVD